MRAWLIVWAALVAASRTADPPHAHPARIDRIKSQILAKLGLTSRPTPVGAPPRDVVRAILARATDYQPQEEHREEQAMREVIAIAHREFVITKVFETFNIKMELRDDTASYHTSSYCWSCK